MLAMPFTFAHRDTVDSPYATQLVEGFRRLRFVPTLEHEFREAYAETNLGRVRLSLILALALLAGVTGVDWWTLPEPLRPWSVAVRIGAVCPFVLLALVASFRSAQRDRLVGYVVLAAIVAGFGTIALELVATAHGIPFLFSGLILVTFCIYFFFGLLCPTATRTALLIMLAYIATAVFITVPWREFAYNSLSLVAANLIGAIGCYILEHHVRTNFLESRLLNQLAERDGLTGLYNRRMFDDYMERVWRQSRRDKALLVLMLVDIDFFKKYNDLYGHQAGDECLKKVATALSITARRPLDFTARYGGEEFIVVLFNPPRQYAEEIPERIRASISAMNIPHQGSEIADRLTVSIGVALTVPREGHSHHGLIALADEALYAAKERGRDCVAVKESELSLIQTGMFRGEVEVQS